MNSRKKMQKDEVTIFTFSFLSFLFLVLQKRFAIISFKLTFKSSNFWTSFILKWIFIASSLHESILSTFQHTLTDKPLFPLRSQSREFADSVTLIEIWLVKRMEATPLLICFQPQWKHLQPLHCTGPCSAPASWFALPKVSSAFLHTVSNDAHSSTSAHSTLHHSIADERKPFSNFGFSCWFVCFLS